MARREEIPEGAGPWPATARGSDLDAGIAGRSHARARSQPASAQDLPGAVHAAQVHLAVPGHRTARFRASGDRLRAASLAGREQVAEALPRQLPTTARSTGLRWRSPRAAGRLPDPRWLRHRRLLGTRAAACRSTCSGRPAGRRPGWDSPTEAWRRTAVAADAPVWYSRRPPWWLASDPSRRPATKPTGPEGSNGSSHAGCQGYSGAGRLHSCRPSGAYAAA